MTLDRMPGSRRLAGILTAAELIRAGVTESELRILVGREALVSVGRGLYARTALVNQLKAMQGGSSSLAIAAAVAGAGPDALASHRAAATLHRLQMLQRAQSDAIEVTRPTGTSGSRTARPGTRLHISALPPGHRALVSGVPVTSVARTVIDLARTASVPEGVAVADSALHGKQTTKTELYAVTESCAGWPGIARARQVVDFSDGLAESAFESIARVAFRDGGLPPPELQATVGADGRVIARADFYWRAHSTIAETDGMAKYSNTGVARRQLERDADLRDAGFQVVHITWQQLQISPDQVVQSIRAAFAQAALMAKISTHQDERIDAG